MSETIVEKLLGKQKNKSRDMLLKSHVVNESNLMVKSRLKRSEQGLDRGQRKYRSVSNLSRDEEMRDRRTSTADMLPNRISRFELLLNELPKPLRRATENQFFHTRLRRTIRPNRPSNFTLSEFNRRKKLSEMDPFPLSMQMREHREIGGEYFLVSVRLSPKEMVIQADLKNYLLGKPKIIRLSRENALSFLKQYCNNQLEQLFSRLHYDGMYLYLLADRHRH